MRIVSAEIRQLMVVIWCEDCETTANAYEAVQDCEKCGKPMSEVGWFEKSTEPSE